jgi:hypothetical protein
MSVMLLNCRRKASLLEPPGILSMASNCLAVFPPAPSSTIDNSVHTVYGDRAKFRGLLPSAPVAANKSRANALTESPIPSASIAQMNVVSTRNTSFLFKYISVLRRTMLLAQTNGKHCSQNAQLTCTSLFASDQSRQELCWSFALLRPLSLNEPPSLNFVLFIASNFIVVCLCSHTHTLDTTECRTDRQ